MGTRYVGRPKGKQETVSAPQKFQREAPTPHTRTPRPLGGISQNARAAGANPSRAPAPWELGSFGGCVYIVFARNIFFVMQRPGFGKGEEQISTGMTS